MSTLYHFVVSASDEEIVVATMALLLLMLLIGLNRMVEFNWSNSSCLAEVEFVSSKLRPPRKWPVAVSGAHTIDIPQAIQQAQEWTTFTSTKRPSEQLLFGRLTLTWTSTWSVDDGLFLDQNRLVISQLQESPTAELYSANINSNSKLTASHFSSSQTSWEPRTATMSRTLDESTSD